ncbi:MAG: hypothetical protein PHQ10_05475 [Dehalococcoidales bacterium]|nr:hypothetical protein [Dehalococcoidales bacterium]MDD3264610.1 hypothetical protein [Dehalococcoidales bacterium]MDD4793666.1 hypothetical protein [Dehalococcoidales bacterium]MDD5122408.1 hypothetical protein [Dehalococcoidales bacterium]MDX9802466.1 hypothetical protein [Dehalococcoidales bacterium]
MPGYKRKLNIAVLSVVLVSLVIVLSVPQTTQAYRVYEKDNGNNYITAEGESGVEAGIIEDAKQQAEALYGKDNPASQDYFHQLIGIYNYCQDIDTLIVFNAGGFGWDSVTDAQGWITIMEGVENWLKATGHNVKVVNFERTRASFEGIVSESLAFWGWFPAKADDLAGRIRFITRNVSGLKVLLAGESNGATIVEETFRRLQGNPNVFAIQTGPTVVQRSKAHERSLVMRHNGKIEDSFSQGDVFTILRSNLEAMLGIYQENPGDILFYIGAPGHYYTWEYPEFRREITSFLSLHFS